MTPELVVKWIAVGCIGAAMIAFVITFIVLLFQMLKNPRDALPPRILREEPKWKVTYKKDE